MPGVACATLVGSSPHLSLSIRVWHAPRSLAHPLLTGCVAATLIITFAGCAAATLIIIFRVCFHPLVLHLAGCVAATLVLLQCAPNKL